MAAAIPRSLGDSSQKTQPVGADRRTHRRFPISAPVRYILADHEGAAITRDMSSNGIFITTREILPAGRVVTLFIDWPAMLDDHCLLRLVVAGKILRSTSQGTAVGISKYEFRVRARYQVCAGMAS